MTKKIFVLVGILILVVIIATGLLLKKNEKTTTLPVQETPKEENKITAENKIVPNLPDQEGLPAPVEARRQAIYKAAIAHDYLGLQDGYMLPDDLGWVHESKNGEVTLKAAPLLLKIPYFFDSYSNDYVWPERGEKQDLTAEWTPADEAYAKKFLTDQELDTYTKESYSGYRNFEYRIIIKPDGKWFFSLPENAD